jgi:hypothetical protein
LVLGIALAVLLAVMFSPQFKPPVSPDTERFAQSLLHPPRAELVAPAPRARLLVSALYPSGRSVGDSRLVRLPNGQEVLTSFMGLTDHLPKVGKIGQEWQLPDGSQWVWLVAPGASTPNWIDP